MDLALESLTVLKDRPRILLLINFFRACSGVLWRPELCIGLLRNVKSSMLILGVQMNDSRKMIGFF